MGFGKLLKRLREESQYPDDRAAAQICDLGRFNLNSYEKELVLPEPKTLDRIIFKLSIPPSDADELRYALKVEKARAAGLVGDNVEQVNVPDVVDQIQREIEYELKRVGVKKFTPKTRRVCKARIEMILRHALGRVR